MKTEEWHILSKSIHRLKVGSVVELRGYFITGSLPNVGAGTLEENKK